MGNSSPTPASPESYSQILRAEYDLFDVSPQLQNKWPGSGSEFKIGTVSSKKYSKANLYASKHYHSPSEWNDQISMYYARHQSKQLDLFPIVKVLGVKQVEQDQLCSTWKSYFVITEEVFTLNAFQNRFSYEECLYILFQCLMGFYYLYVRHGNFQITQNMITVNSQGKIKVWLNQNLAQNQSENGKIQVYMTKDLSPSLKQSSKPKGELMQVQMVNNILKIIDKRFAAEQASFSKTLQKNLRGPSDKCDVKSFSFEDLLRQLCEYEQKNESRLFIPNRLQVKKEYKSKLPERESFSVKLQKAIETYREQKAFLEDSGLRSYSTGLQGNSLKKYVPIETAGFERPNMKPVNVRFRYQDPLMLRSYNLNQNGTQFNYSQFYRDYSIGEAESEIIGIRRSQFLERIEDFHPNQANLYPQYSYLPSEFEKEIETFSKDLRETYFKSTGDSRSFESSLPKSRSLVDNKFQNQSKSQNQSLSKSSSELQLITSKYVEDLVSTRNQTAPSDYKYYPVPSDYKYYPVGSGSTYKQKLIAEYLHGQPTNNFMRITEELQQESYRPSLANISVEGKTSTENKDNKVRDSISYKNSSDHLKLSSQNGLQNIVAPIIESRLTQNFRISPDYLEKPFSLSHNTKQSSSDGEENSNLQTGKSFYR